MEKNKAVVTVHGREYTMLGVETPEYMQRVAAYVDRRMQEIGYATYWGEQRLTMLTALNIADELFKAKDDMTAMRREMTQMRQNMHRLEVALKKAEAAAPAPAAEKPKKS